MHIAVGQLLHQGAGVYCVAQKTYEDNKSTMLLKTNVCMLSRRRTTHINARYFVAADRVIIGGVEVEHCLAEHMWAGVLNNPKQGMPYRVFRGELMNVPELYDDKKEHLKTHLALLDNTKETLDNNQPL